MPPKKTPKPIKVFEQLVTVRIAGLTGLFEMMRYDQCIPATEEESYKLGRLVQGAPNDGDREVRLRRFSNNENGPNVVRWRSFHCEVLSWSWAE